MDVLHPHRLTLNLACQILNILISSVLSLYIYNFSIGTSHPTYLIFFVFHKTLQCDNSMIYFLTVDNSPVPGLCFLYNFQFEVTWFDKEHPYSSGLGLTHYNIVCRRKIDQTHLTRLLYTSPWHYCYAVSNFPISLVTTISLRFTPAFQNIPLCCEFTIAYFIYYETPELAFMRVENEERYDWKNVME